MCLPSVPICLLCNSKMKKHSHYIHSVRSSIDTRHSGFSLVELLITIAIISIMTVIVIVKYGAFNSSVLLKSQAYELALNIREAQTYAVSVRGEQGTFRDGYGLYFSASSPMQYFLFIDVHENEPYDAGAEIGRALTVDPRFVISSIKSGTCVSGTDVSALSVTFRRPDFDAIISTGSTYACVTLATASGPSMTRSVEVSATGQITVK